MFTVQSSPFRCHLEKLLDSARQDLLVASPYIKTREAEWVCNRLVKNGHDKHVRLQLLTDVRSSNVLRGSLDVTALRLLQKRIGSLRDHKCSSSSRESVCRRRGVCHRYIRQPHSIWAGLEFRIRVGFTDPATVRSVRQDWLRYSTLGNPLSSQTIIELERVSDQLRVEFHAIEQSTEKKLRRKFNETLKRADYQFLRAQIGTRSAHGVFADAMVYLLSIRPMSTQELHEKLKALLPELCDDRAELVINGQHFGKKWKHVVRNAQTFLRRKDAIQLIGKEWHVNLR